MPPYSSRMFRDDKCICPEGFMDMEGLEQKTCFFEDPDHLMCLAAPPDLSVRSSQMVYYRI